MNSLFTIIRIPVLAVLLSSASIHASQNNTENNPFNNAAMLATQTIDATVPPRDVEDENRQRQIDMRIFMTLLHNEMNHSHPRTPVSTRPPCQAARKSHR